jgi:hypothetical protein
MNTLQKKDSAIDHSRAQANQLSVQRVGFPAVYGHISAPAQLKKGVIQRIWFERVNGTVTKKEDPRPTGTHKPFNNTPYVGEDGKKVTVTVWEPKVKAPAPLTYKQKLGNVPAAGEFTIAANLVRFSQDSISSTFTSGADINATITALKDKTLDPSLLPAIRVIWSKQDSAHEEARLVTLDNRRLYCCQQAGVKVKCVLVDWDNLDATTKKKESKKLTSGKGREGRATIDVRL